MNEDEAAPVRRDDTRLRILNAARELFGSDGFDGTTIKQIAERVGLTDAALYYHFRSKREILTALWEVPLGGGVRRFRPGATFDARRIDEITEASIDFTVANDHVLRLMCREILNGDQVALALRQQSRSVLRRTLHEHFLTITGAEDAEIRTEAVMAIVTGAGMKLQMESGGDFPSAAASPEFRERTRRWVRRVARLEETAGV